MVKIQAAVLREKSGRFSFESVDVDGPRADEVLVRIVATGICHTDLSVRDQFIPVTLPAVLGHEGAGIVEAIGDHVTKVEPGDSVVLSYCFCGTCFNCRRSSYSCCSKLPALNFGGVRLDTGRSPYSDDSGAPVSGLFFGQSSFASHSLARECNVVKIRSDVPLELMGPLGCGIQTGAGTVMNSLKPSSGDSIVVFGAGSVGLSAVMAAVVVGCATIIAVDLHQNRLDLARELGATHALKADSGDVVKQIVALTGDGAQFTIECTGSPKVLRQAVEALRITGVCAIVGAAPRGTEVSLPMGLLGSGRTIKGVIEGDSIADLFIPELIELWREGRFPFDKLIRRYPMAQINEAIAASESGEVLKPVLCNQPTEASVPEALSSDTATSTTRRPTRPGSTESRTASPASSAMSSAAASSPR